MGNGYQSGNHGGAFSGDNGPALSAELYYPFGVAVDPTGNIYIADSYNQRIRKVSGGVITTVAGNGGYGYAGDNGPATQARLALPMSVALDAAGSFYIPDTTDNVVRKVSAGVITTVAGLGGQGESGDNGPALRAQLNGPIGVAADAAGNLYITDGGGGRIRMVVNGVITTIAGSGPAYPDGGYNGDNIPAIDAWLFCAESPAVDAAERVFRGYRQSARPHAEGVFIQQHRSRRLRIVGPVEVGKLDGPYQRSRQRLLCLHKPKDIFKLNIG